MRFRVTHDRHFQWEIIKEADVKPGDHVTPANKQGEVSRRSAVDCPGNFTLVEWPEHEVEREMNARRLALVPENPQLDPTNAEAVAADARRRRRAAANLSVPVTRAQLALEYLAKAGLKHHVPTPGDVTYIEDLGADKDHPDLGPFLREAFGCKGSPAPSTSDPPQSRRRSTVEEEA